MTNVKIRRTKNEIIELGMAARHMSPGGFIEKPLSLDCYCTRPRSFAALLRIPTLSSSIEMAGVEQARSKRGEGASEQKDCHSGRRKTEGKSNEGDGDRRSPWIGTRLTFQGYRTFDNCESFIP